ncbi:hypothetical protein EWM64_g8418 [Hericium alpestre]|uniref:CCHC-type domain-containing protein n=1 Tax=Hericium alpestre TaxID=135208 RepID=A0A4Y9ZMW0_9AGAM|nr:hypothetical protein EWM64_g8418 [Hericium alpestre]
MIDPAVAAAARIAELEARIAAFENPANQAQAAAAKLTPVEAAPLVADPAAIECTRVVALLIAEENKKGSVSERIKKAFQSYTTYVPYTALTPSACFQALLGSADFVVNAEGGLTSKPFDRSGELSISLADWLAAARLAESLITKFHPLCVAAWQSHHEVIHQIESSHGHSIAMAYDVQQRSLASSHPQHDLSGLDDRALSLIVSQRLAARMKSLSFPTPTPRTPSFKRRGSDSLPAPASPEKKVRAADRHCFRCGQSGHYPAECTESRTTAGKPTAPIAPAAAGQHPQLPTPDQLEAVIGPFRTSPLGLVPKPHSDKLRLVEDLSFPRNDPCVASVNAGINSDDFPTAWGTFADASALILSLLPGAEAATFDIQYLPLTASLPFAQTSSICSAYSGMVPCMLTVQPASAWPLVLASLVQLLLVAISRASGFFPILKWVDDFLLIRLPDQLFTEADFTALMGTLGVPWSAEKMRPFATCQRYIGFDWDLARKTVALPLDKLEHVQVLVASWRAPNAKFSASDAASLHGKLVHTSSIFPLIRPFLRALSHFASHFSSPRARLFPTKSLLADLSWIQDLLARLPNELPLASSDPMDIGWWGDASTSFGVGVVVGGFWGVWQWAPGFRVGPRCPFDIGWAEAVAVELGLLMAVHHGVLAAHSHAASRFLVCSDNSGVVAIVNRGRLRSSTTNDVLKCLYIALVDHRIWLSATYVASRDNVTDTLSRGDIAAFLAGFPGASAHMDMPLPLVLSGSLTPL